MPTASFLKNGNGLPKSDPFPEAPKARQNTRRGISGKQLGLLDPALSLRARRSSGLDLSAEAGTSRQDGRNSR